MGGEKGVGRRKGSIIKRRKGSGKRGNKTRKGSGKRGYKRRKGSGKRGNNRSPREARGNKSGRGRKTSQCEAIQNATEDWPSRDCCVPCIPHPSVELESMPELNELACAVCARRRIRLRTRAVFVFLHSLFLLRIRSCSRQLLCLFLFAQPVCDS